MLGIMNKKGQSLEGIVILLIFLFGFMALFYVLPLFYTFPTELNVDSSHTEALATNTSEAFTAIFANFKISVSLILGLGLIGLVVLSNLASNTGHNNPLLLIVFVIILVLLFILIAGSGSTNFTFSGNSFDGSASGFSGGGGGGFS